MWSELKINEVGLSSIYTIELPFTVAMSFAILVTECEVRALTSTVGIGRGSLGVCLQTLEIRGKKKK